MPVIQNFERDLDSVTNYIPNILSKESLDELVEEAFDYAHVSCIYCYIDYISKVF